MAVNFPFLPTVVFSSRPLATVQWRDYHRAMKRLGSRWTAPITLSKCAVAIIRRNYQNRVSVWSMNEFRPHEFYRIPHRCSPSHLALLHDHRRLDTIRTSRLAHRSSRIREQLLCRSRRSAGGSYSFARKFSPGHLPGPRTQSVGCRRCDRDRHLQFRELGLRCSDTGPSGYDPQSHASRVLDHWNHHRWNHPLLGDHLCHRHQRPLENRPGRRKSCTGRGDGTSGARFRRRPRMEWLGWNLGKQYFWRSVRPDLDHRRQLPGREHLSPRWVRTWQRSGLAIRLWKTGNSSRPR